MKLLYSLTAHESVSSILDLCFNLIYVAKANYLFIHINKESNEVYEKLIKIIDKNIFLKDTIYITPKRHNTGKNQYKLHLAHLENYKYALEKKFLYDYFILEASNTLYVKKGIINHIKDFDVGIGRGKVTGYWEERIYTHKSLEKFFKKYSVLGRENILQFSVKGVHEGSFYSCSVASKIFFLIERLDKFCYFNNDLAWYPTEEVWFQIALELVSETDNTLKISRTLTYMPWHKQLIWKKKEIMELLVDQKKLLPDYTFAIKRVDRKFDDPIRKYIGNYFGYRKKVEEIIK